MTPPIITIGGRNSPFAVALMLVCTIAGGLGVTGGHPDVVPFSVFDLRLWYFGLLIGSLVALTGMGWRDPITGMLIERVGQFILASLMFAYAAGMVLLADTAAGFVSAAASTLVFALACSARVVQIHIAARRIRAAVKLIDELKS